LVKRQIFLTKSLIVIILFFVLGGSLFYAPYMNKSSLFGILLFLFSVLFVVIPFNNNSNRLLCLMRIAIAVLLMWLSFYLKGISAIVCIVATASYLYLLVECKN
jgi:hypothetical protein